MHYIIYTSVLITAIDFHLTGYGSSPKPCSEAATCLSSPKQQITNKEVTLESSKELPKPSKDQIPPLTKTTDSVEEPLRKSHQNTNNTEPLYDLLNQREETLKQIVNNKTLAEDDEDSSLDEYNPFSDKYNKESEKPLESKPSNENKEKDKMTSSGIMLGFSVGSCESLAADVSTNNEGDYDNIVYTFSPDTPYSRYNSNALGRSSTFSVKDNSKKTSDKLSNSSTSAMPIPPSRPSRKFRRINTIENSGTQLPLSSSQTTIHMSRENESNPKSSYLTGSTPNISLLSLAKGEEGPSSPQYTTGYGASLWTRPNHNPPYHSMKRGSEPCIITYPTQFANSSLMSSYDKSKQRPQFKLPDPTSSSSQNMSRVSKSLSQSQNDVSGASKPRQANPISNTSKIGAPVDKGFHKDAYSTAFALASLGAGDSSTDYLTRVRAMWDDQHSQTAALPNIAPEIYNKNKTSGSKSDEVKLEADRKSISSVPLASTQHFKGPRPFPALDSEFYKPSSVPVKKKSKGQTQSSSRKSG